MFKACMLAGTMSLGTMGLAQADSCCGGKTQCDMPAATVAATQPTTQPASATYVCPMGCETSDKPGKCSKCGMDLVKKQTTGKQTGHENHAH